MIVISDTNILSSLAAGNIFSALFQLFASPDIHIPPAVFQELQAGMNIGKTYLAPVLQAIASEQIAILALSPYEEQLAQSYPSRLNLGECQAIALAHARNSLLLSNDKRAIRYCQAQAIRVLNLENILRQLWIRKILSPTVVRQAIKQMASIEQLVIPPERQAVIFAPSTIDDR